MIGLAGAASAAAVGRAEMLSQCVQEEQTVREASAAGRDGEAPRTRGRRFCYEEVRRHNRKDDCWVIVDGGVYDVTAFVPRHPGGNMIYINAGKDSTYLFECYHPAGARRVLEHFWIGEIDTQEKPDPFNVVYEDREKDKEFYQCLQRRVRNYFKENKINPRVSAEMYVKCLVILVGLGLGAYGAFFYSFSNFLWSIVCAVLLGFFTAEVGLSIMHDANHSAFSDKMWLNKVVGWSLDLCGVSSFMWKQQHVIGHHVYTNVDGADPDIRVNDPDVRRVYTSQPWRPYQVYQHIYLGFLYALLSIKSVVADDFMALSRGYIGAVPISQMTLEEQVVFWTGKGVWTAYFVVLPLLYGQHDLPRLFFLWAVSQAVTGWLLAFMFQVAHVTSEVEFYSKPTTSPSTVPQGWAATQVQTTADFAHNSWFWTHVSGGLNYQVVHHLFPWVCHMHYPKIAPLVMQTCSEYGLPYVVFPTFQSAVNAHLQHMEVMGKSPKSE